MQMSQFRTTNHLQMKNTLMQPIRKDWNLQVANNLSSFLFKYSTMKRVFLSTLLAFLVTGLFAQKLDKAKDLLKANKLDEAKTEIDGVLANEKNQKDADAWYTKAKIYNAIAAADKTKANDAHAVAFD